MNGISFGNNGGYNAGSSQFIPSTTGFDDLFKMVVAMDKLAGFQDTRGLAKEIRKKSVDYVKANPDPAFEELHRLKTQIESADLTIDEAIELTKCKVVIHSVSNTISNKKE